MTTTREERMADAVIGVIKRALTPRDKRLEAVESRLAALEARPVPKYCGTFVQGKTYAACSLVTRQGGLWICSEATTMPPGSGGPWQLIVKSGGAER
jgi:hypothetical protein